MFNQKSVKILLNFTGYLLLFASFYFLFCKIWHYKLIIFQHFSNKIALIISFLAGLSYTIIYVLFVLSWYFLLQPFENVNFRKVYLIYSRSQIAKYLPGNIFHYAGRYLKGHLAGLKQFSLFIATFLETLLMIIVTIIIAISGILFLDFGQDKFKFLLIIGLFLICLTTLIIIFFPKTFRSVPILRNYFTFHINLKHWIKVIIFSLLLYIISFIFLGILLWSVAIVCFKIEISKRTFFAFPTVFSTAWVLGFITPGAPGGIGVREAILTSGLTPFIGASTAISMAIIARFITILGDFFFYLSSYIVPKILKT